MNPRTPPTSRTSKHPLVGGGSNGSQGEARPGLAACALVALGLSSGACFLASADQEPAELGCPSDASFPVVSQVLERRCGTLDCHGDPSRPLRLYGRNGTRLTDADRVGIDPTTPAELEENRFSLCGLEPEKMSAVVAGEGDVDDLTLTRKPRLIEAHKGGRVWLDDSVGYRCLSTWIEGDADVDACESELRFP